MGKEADSEEGGEQDSVPDPVADAEGGGGDGGEEGGPASAEAKARHSCKASFLAKVLGPITDYGADHDLAQFVYDLWLWSARRLQERDPRDAPQGGHAGQALLARVLEDQVQGPGFF